MAFIAECPFCRVKLQKVPDHREGDSTECPRCHNLFTLAAMISPPKLRPSSTATLLHLFWITVGVGGAAALCAVVALAAGPRTRGVAKMPLYALLLSLAVVGLTTVWSSLLGFEAAVTRDLTEGTGKITVLPRAERSKTTRAAVEQLPWVDATDSSIEHDGIRVQIVSAVVQPV